MSVLIIESTRTYRVDEKDRGRQVRPQGTATRYEKAPTQTIRAAGAVFTYREVGPSAVLAPPQIPLVVLTHLGANLDGWDPQVIDGLAREHHIIALGYRGVGNSSGRVHRSIEAMASDVIDILHGLGHQRVDLFGMSMGGMVAQAVLARAPQLVDRLIVSGAGPAGGPSLRKIRGVALRGAARAALTFADPKTRLFFTRTSAGRAAARDYLRRLKERTLDRERKVTEPVFRAQLTAVGRWGRTAPSGRSSFSGSVWIVHGDNDRMVPPANVEALRRVFPAARVKVYPDSGHGVVFQNHQAFVDEALDFLRR